MLQHYFKSFFINIKKNRFFYTINLVGFLTGFLLLSIIFTFVYQEVSFDRFNQNADHIYRIHSGGYGVTPMCFAEKLKNQLPEISHIVRLNRTEITFVKQNEEFTINKCYYSDPDVFQMFSFNLTSGDKASALNTPFSLVINQTMAMKLFGNHSPIGETVQAKNNKIYTITGVMDDIPENSHLSANAFVSMETLRQIGDEFEFGCGSWSILTYISLTDGAKPGETEAKINTLLEDSRMGSKDGKIPLQIEPLKKIYFDYDNNKYDGSKHGDLQTVILYLAIAILILIIVVINYINLSTAISGSRMKEFAIRKVNGASTFEIIMQNVLEAVGPIFLAFAIALGIIEFMLPQISQLLNLNVYILNSRFQLYFCFFVIILIVGLLTGLVPGLLLSKVNETKALKNESALKSRGLQRKLLLGVQLVIVAVLLNSVFIVKKQINFIFNKNLGINAENVVVARLNKTLKDNAYLIRNNLLQNPQIKAVSFSDGMTGDGFTKKAIRVDETEDLAYFYSIDPEYTGLFQIKLKYGRNLSWNMTTDFKNGCLVNEEFCKVFGIKNPVNKSIGSMTIVGVVDNFNYLSLHQKIEPLILACANSGNTVQIKIGSEDPNAAILFIKNCFKSIAPEEECDVFFLNDNIRNLYHSEMNLKQSFEIYAVVTLFISLTGLWGLTLFTIRKKTKETCIRKLHGATLFDTFRMLSREQVSIVLVSNVLAIPFSYWVMSRWLSNFEYQTTIGYGVFLATFVVTLAFNLLAISLLLFKTYRANLVETLKYE